MHAVCFKHLHPLSLHPHMCAPLLNTTTLTNALSGLSCIASSLHTALALAASHPLHCARTPALHIHTRAPLLGGPPHSPAATVSSAAAARSLQSGNNQDFFIGQLSQAVKDKVSSFASKLHKGHSTYATQTVLAAQPTVVIAPMPQLAPVQTVTAPVSQEAPPPPTTTKTKSLTIAGKGKSITLTKATEVPVSGSNRLSVCVCVCLVVVFGYTVVLVVFHFRFLRAEWFGRERGVGSLLPHKQRSAACASHLHWH
jgi:hypothetical protein